jgi:hypothetical protein
MVFSYWRKYLWLNVAFSDAVQKNGIKTMKTLKLAIAGVVLLGAVSSQAQGFIVDPYISSAAGIQPHSAFTETGGGTVGSYFTVSSVITVTNAGIWDYSAAMLGNDNAGLLQSHDIEVWSDVSGTYTPLDSAIVLAGTADYLADGFRWAALATPLTLVPGTTYVIGAYYSGVSDDLIADGSHVADSPFNWVSDADSNPAGSPPQGSLQVPTFNDLTQGLFGPNLAVEVPEPATFSLLLLPLGAFAVRKLRNNRRS